MDDGSWQGLFCHAEGLKDKICLQAVVGAKKKMENFAGFQMIKEHF